MPAFLAKSQTESPIYAAVAIAYTLEEITTS